MPPASAGASAAEVRTALFDLLEPLVAGSGYDLEDVAVSAAGRRSMVRVTVDSDRGIDLDAVATISRVVSEVLDESLEGDGVLARALAGSYVLEVSSPGVDRPLTQPRHWRRAVGRLVTTTMHGKAVTGRVTAADDDAATLNIKGRTQTVAWSDLGPGKVQIEFNRSTEEE